MFSFLRVTLGTISQGTKCWHKLPNWQGEKQSIGMVWVGRRQLWMLPHAAPASSPRELGSAASPLPWGQHELSTSPGRVTPAKIHSGGEPSTQPETFEQIWATSTHAASLALAPSFSQGNSCILIFFHLSLQASHLCLPYLASTLQRENQTT